MKILTTIDSFKGSFSSQEANHIVATAFKNWSEVDQVTEVAIADGGEGTIEALTINLGGEILQVPTVDLKGNKIEAKLGWIEEKQCGIIEVAEAVGITFLDGTKSTHPYVTNSWGVGQLIRTALDKGARQIAIGLGGTGVIDLGWGMAAALGLKVYDSNGEHLEPLPRNFSRASRIDTTEIDQRMAVTEIILLNDVGNPLFGSEGAVRLFGEQKGLSTGEFAEYERAASVFADLVEFGTHTVPGDGAAGGIGFMIRNLFHGKYRPGFEFISEALDLEKLVEDCDMVITGEGRIDQQSLIGKVPVGVASLAKKSGKPCIAFTGKNELTLSEYEAYGFTAIVPIVDRVMTLDEAMVSGKDNLVRACTLSIGLLKIREWGNV